MNASPRAHRPHADAPDANPESDGRTEEPGLATPDSNGHGSSAPVPGTPFETRTLWLLAGALGVLGLLLSAWAHRVGASDMAAGVRLAASASALLGAGALLGGSRLLQGPAQNPIGLWLPVISAALFTRALWLGLGGLASNPRAHLLLDALALLSFALEFGAALLFATRSPAPSTSESDAAASESSASQRRLRLVSRVVAAWDGLALGMGACALAWWAWRVPLMLRSLPAGKPASGAGLPGLLAFGLSVGALALLASWLYGRHWVQRSSSQKSDWAGLASGVLALAGALGLSLAQLRWLNVGVRGALGSVDAVAGCLAPLALAAGLLLACSYAASPAQAAPSSWESEEEAGAPSLEAWALALACAAALAMAWRLGVAALGASPWSLWWAPLLVASSALRLAWRGQGGSKGSREARREVAQLKRVVARRTHQLATLHSMTAELSDTLSCERILSTAVERALVALDARCAAIWLNIDVSEISLEDRPLGSQGIEGAPGVTRAVPVAVFVWREMERTGTERRALDNLRLDNTDLMGRRTQKIGGSGGALAGVAVADKSWSMALARGNQHENARRVLSEMHRLLEFNGLERFANLAHGDASALDIQPRDVGLRTITVQTPNAVTTGVAGPHAPQLRAGARADKNQGTADDSASLDENARQIQELRQVLEQAHLAPIRSKGESLGALGAWREGAPLDEAERSLVAALALEVGAVLQNVQLYQETSRLADRDPLTDLLNHRAIQSQLNSILARTQRAEGVFAVVMMDLNNFKFFNDTYGHPEGDRVLRTVARCLREACRAGDIIGRFGGDEFIALLIDTDAEGTLQACQRIAERVKEEGYQQRGDARRIPITLSFGAALFPQDGTTALDLLTAADSHLYEAKRGGGAINITKQGGDEDELRKLKEAGVGGSFGVLDALVTAIDNKDHYTRRHSEDVTHWASLMARQLEFSPETLRAVRVAGLLHDVGKIAVPDSILRKPGRLGDDEFQIMQQHPVFGALIVKDVPNLPEVLGGIRHHHERWDGKGYPDKLKAENIPLLGRLLAVPDCFSAMTTDRPYRKALTWVEAMDEIEKGKGTQFDAVMADAFLEVMAHIISGAPDEPTPEGALPEGDMGAQAGDAEAVARSMADPEAKVVAPDEDEPQFQPRSVADAEK